MRLIRKIQTKIKKAAFEKALAILKNQAEVIAIENTPENLNQIRSLLYKSDNEFPATEEFFKKFRQDLIIGRFAGLFVFLKNGKDYSLLNINGLTDIPGEDLPETKKESVIVGNVVEKTR